MIVDASGRIVLVNQQTEEMFGYERDELMGRRIEVLLPERVRVRHVGHRDGYIADPRTVRWASGSSLPGVRRTAASSRSTSR